jgi:hypothetical protein
MYIVPTCHMYRRAGLWPQTGVGKTFIAGVEVDGVVRW